MNDPLLVSGLERVGDLPRDPDRIVCRHRPIGNELGERLTLDELEHQGAHAVLLFDPVNGGDMWMVQRRERLRLALEPRQALGIGREGLRQHLQGNLAVQPRIARAIDLAHPARAEGGDDFVGAETGARGH